MPDVSKRILWTLGGLAVTIPLGYIGRVALAQWGVLDPFALWLGGWLHMHVAPAQAEWTIAAIVAALAYSVLLGVVWRHFRRPEWNASDGAKLARSIGHEVASVASQQRPALDGDWKTPLEAIETFGSKSARDERDRLKQKADEVWQRGKEAEEEIRKIRKKYPSALPPDGLCTITPTGREYLCSLGDFLCRCFAACRRVQSTAVARTTSQ